MSTTDQKLDQIIALLKRQIDGPKLADLTPQEKQEAYEATVKRTPLADIIDHCEKTGVFDRVAAERRQAEKARARRIINP